MKKRKNTRKRSYEYVNFWRLNPQYIRSRIRWDKAAFYLHRNREREIERERERALTINIALFGINIV